MGVGPGAQLSAHKLLEEATAVTGLDDFGEQWSVSAFETVIRLINAEAGLISEQTPSVLFLKKMIIDRLRFVDFVKKNPAARDEKVNVVGIIVGLTRGGSTLLHRLLGASPQITAPCVWETMEPVPLPGGGGDSAGRIKMSQAIIDDLRARWPESASMHPMSPMDYEEETFLLSRTFIGVEYGFHFNIPSYLPWVRTQDQAAVYDELKLWLQVLQYQQPSRRRRKWLLKSGQHAWTGGLRNLMDVFPDAKAIMTHRGLESVIPSQCSLRRMVIRHSSSNFDLKDLGREFIVQYRDGICDYLALRDELPAHRFVDVQYKDVVAEPMTEYRRGLAAMEIEFSEEDEQAGAAWVAANGRDTHPRHKYTPEEFGTTREELVDTFRFYTQRYLRA
jgi:hypothetical protein